LRHGFCDVRVKGVTTQRLSAGSLFGERSLLTNEPRDATVVVSELKGSAKFLTIRKKDFKAALCHGRTEQQEGFLRRLEDDLGKRRAKVLGNHDLETEGCTFKPSVTRGPLEARQDGASIWDSLHARGVERQQQRQQAMEGAEDPVQGPVPSVSPEFMRFHQSTKGVLSRFGMSKGPHSTSSSFRPAPRLAPSCRSPSGSVRTFSGSRGRTPSIGRSFSSGRASVCSSRR